MSPEKMPPNRSPTGTLRSSAAVDAFARAIDDMDKNDAPSVERDESQLEMELDTWIEHFAGLTELRSVLLSDEALLVVSGLVPNGSLTDEAMARIEAKRRKARQDADAIRNLVRKCDAQSPGALLHLLRRRAGLPNDAVATALDMSVDSLLAIEADRAPWYQMRPEVIPVFANLVGESLADLISLMRITARRFFIREVKQRTSLSLGRFDKTQEISEADRNKALLAFERLKDHNRAAGMFLEQVERLSLRASANTEQSSRL